MSSILTTIQEIFSFVVDLIKSFFDFFASLFSSDDDDETATA